MDISSLHAWLGQGGLCSWVLPVMCVSEHIVCHSWLLLSVVPDVCVYTGTSARMCNSECITVITVYMYVLSYVRMYVHIITTCQNCPSSITCHLRSSNERSAPLIVNAGCQQVVFCADAHGHHRLTSALVCTVWLSGWAAVIKGSGRPWGYMPNLFQLWCWPSAGQWSNLVIPLRLCCPRKRVSMCSLHVHIFGVVRCTVCVQQRTTFATKLCSQCVPHSLPMWLSCKWVCVGVCVLVTIASWFVMTGLTSSVLCIRECVMASDKNGLLTTGCDRVQIDIAVQSSKLWLLVKYIMIAIRTTCISDFSRYGWSWIVKLLWGCKVGFN